MIGAATRHLRSLGTDRFIRRVALLSSGVVFGQAVAALASPLLSRLYTPEAFGVFGVYSSLLGMIGTAVALRYELAVPVCKDDETAAEACLVSLLACFITVALLVPVIWATGPWLAAITAMPGLRLGLWLLVPSLLGWGLALPLNAWSICRGTYRTNALGRALQLTGQTVAQILSGLVMASGLGLVLGAVLGHLIRLALFVGSLPRSDWALLRSVRRGAIVRVAREQWRYPAYSSPSALLQSGTQFLPALLMAALYGPAVAGWFAFGQRLLEMPVALLSISASSVYLGEVRGLDAVAVRQLFLRTAGRFLALGLLGMLPLLLFGPQIFAIVFGEAWRTAGTMVQYLIPVQLARFVILPIAQTLNLFGRQELHLLSAGLNLGTLALSFGLGRLLTLPPLTTLGLFSLGSSAAYLLYLLLAWRVVRQAALAGTEPAPR